MQSSRDVPAGQTGVGQTILKASFPPELGVSEPWDVTKVQVSEYYAGDRRYTQEPVFVPKSSASRDPSKPFDANEGYIMVLVNDMRDPVNPKTCLEILDAENLEAGPLAVIHGEVCMDC
jgi:carotenoid cleavage dioxygenase-like enzyme